jgi:hypothetical protein
MERHQFTHKIFKELAHTKQKVNFHYEGQLVNSE